MWKGLEEQMKPTQAKSRWFHYKDKRVVYSFCIIGVLCVNSLCRRCTPLFFFMLFRSYGNVYYPYNRVESSATNAYSTCVLGQLTR